MKKRKWFIIINTNILLLIIILSCNNDDLQNQENEIQVKLIEQICCGNLMTLKRKLVSSSCENYKDSLLSVINPNGFPILQNSQIGDIITIEYEQTANCEASCDIICNRSNGIPIKLLNVKN